MKKKTIIFILGFIFFIALIIFTTFIFISPEAKLKLGDLFGQKIEKVIEPQQQLVTEYEKPVTDLKLQRINDKLNITWNERTVCANSYYNETLNETICNETRIEKDYVTIRGFFYYLGDNSTYTFAEAHTLASVTYDYWVEREGYEFKFGGVVNLSQTPQVVKDKGYYLVFRLVNKSENIKLRLDGGKLWLDDYVAINWRDRENPENSFKLYDKKTAYMRKRVPYECNVTDEMGENITSTCYNYTAYHDTIIYDPTVEISDVSINSVFEDVVPENNFTHLNISDVAPYDDLVLYMPFDDNISSTTAYDYTHYNNDGTITNALSTSAGYIGNAMEFDGADDYIDCGSDASLNLTGAITISAWVYMKNAMSYPTIVAKDATYHYQFQTTTRKPDLYLYGANPSWDNEASTALTLNTWSHVAVTYNGTNNLTYYLNGVVDKSYIVTGGAISASKYDVGIGYRIYSEGYPFNGTIDEVMIFNTSLTADQISDIYNNQSARYKSSGTAIYNTSITAGCDRLNITSEILNFMSTNVSLRVWNNGDDVWTAYQNLTTSENYTFIIDDTATEINLSYLHIAGPNQFYSPIHLGNIIIANWSTSVSDSEYPIFTNYVSSPPNNSAYVSGQLYEFNVSVTSTNGTVILEFNGINYSANNTGTVFNASFSDLAAGTYIYYWKAWGNGTDNNFNYTTNMTYVVVNATPTASITNSETWAETYPTEVRINHSETNSGDSDVTYLLHRDNVTKLWGELITLGAGSYHYLLNTTGGQNYSAVANLDTELLVISQGTGDVYCYVNHTRANFVMTNTTATTCENIYLNSTLTTGTGNIQQEWNGSIINIGASPLANLTNLSIGYYNATATYSGNINYTADYETWWINCTTFTGIAPPPVVFQGRIYLIPNTGRVLYIQLNKSLDFT